MRLFEALRDIWQEMDAQTRVRSGYALIALLVAALAWSALAGRVAMLEKKRAARETVVKELLPLKLSYRIAKQASDQLTGRMSSLRPDDTPAKIIEEIGIKGKGVKISPLKGETAAKAFEEYVQRFAGDAAKQDITEEDITALVHANR